MTRYVPRQGGLVTRETKQGGIQSVEMTLRVLLAVAEGAGPRALKDIAQSANLAPSSTHRHLSTLVNFEMVEQDSHTGRYSLGVRIVELGLKALSRRDAVRLAGAMLEELRDQVEYSVFLSIWGNYGPTVVRWEEGNHAVTVHVRVGAVLPLMRSATGRVFLAWLPSGVTAAMVQSEKGARKEVERLREITRERGLGSVEGDLLPGVASLSAPVFDHRGHIVAAISALGTQGVFDSSHTGAIAQKLKKAADSLSNQLRHKFDDVTNGKH